MWTLGGHISNHHKDLWLEIVKNEWRRGYNAKHLVWPPGSASSAHLPSDLIFCSCTPPYILFLLHSQSTALLGFLHSLDTSPQQLFHLLVPLIFCNLQFNCDHQPPCSLLGSPENSATLQIVSISFQKIWQLKPASLTTKRKTTHRKWTVINTSLVHSRGNPLCAANSQEVGIILFSFYRL